MARFNQINRIKHIRKGDIDLTNMKLKSIEKHNLKYLLLTNTYVFAIGFSCCAMLRRNLWGLNIVQSGLVLILFHIIVSLAMTCAEWKKRKDTYDAIANTVLSLGIYTVLTFHNYKWKEIVIILGLAALVIALRLTDLLLRYRKSGEKKKTWRLSIRDTKTVLSAALALIFFLCSYARLFGPAFMYSSEIPHVNTDQTYVEMLDSNIDTISKLNENRFKTLSVKEKLDVLQCIDYIESAHLGIKDYSLKVGTGDTAEGTNGYYEHQQRIIVINSGHLSDSTSWSVCETVCHEIFHCYENCLSEMYISTDSKYQSLYVFNRISKYTKEFNDYVDPDKDFLGYFTQELESDAYEYGIYKTLIYQKIAKTGKVPEMNM